MKKFLLISSILICSSYYQLLSDATLEFGLSYQQFDASMTDFTFGNIDGIPKDKYANSYHFALGTDLGLLPKGDFYYQFKVGFNSYNAKFSQESSYSYITGNGDLLKTIKILHTTDLSYNLWNLGGIVGYNFNPFSVEFGYNYGIISNIKYDENMSIADPDSELTFGDFTRTKNLAKGEYTNTQNPMTFTLGVFYTLDFLNIQDIDFKVGAIAFYQTGIFKDIDCNSLGINYLNIRINYKF